MDKKIKIWLSAFVFTLMTVGGAASYVAQKNVLYRGLQAQDNAYASVLNSEEISRSLPLPNVTTVKAQSPEPEKIQPKKIKPAAVVQKIYTKINPVKSPCEGGSPIIKNSQIVGCTVSNITAQPTTCESNGRYTYTGPDQPGITYGSCIDCETTKYILNKNKCS